MTRRRASGKSAAAFRTISEAAEELQLPQHVLRFWETKFDAVQPVKRGGGRRYYRPEDIDLLRRIRDLLYTDGYQIKDVQGMFAGGEMTVPARHTNQDKAGVRDHEDAQTGAVSAEGQAIGDTARQELEHVLADLTAARDRLRRVRGGGGGP